ncbi:MAG: Ankyrin [Jatrophihabitantaceae bacterium]|nr:Ankyrin [Jatrophihabitantaceae bacterium]
MTGADGAWDPAVLDFAHRMFELAREGSAPQLADALEQGLPPNLTNDKGDTLLILAAYHAHPEAVEVLLAAGADTARANDRGQTALAAAVFRQNEPIVRALMAAGADPHAGGPTAVEMATFFNLPAMSALLEP